MVWRDLKQGLAVNFPCDGQHLPLKRSYAPPNLCWPPGELKRMKILITGRAGFTGSAFKASSDHLVPAGPHAYGLPVPLTNRSNSFEKASLRSLTPISAEEIRGNRSCPIAMLPSGWAGRS